MSYWRYDGANQAGNPLDKGKAGVVNLMAISLWQPWAHFMALGLKTIETRSWRTPYFGPLAIHAARRPICSVGESILAQFENVDRPTDFGCILAIVDLCGCLRTEDCEPSELDRVLGDYSADRFAWVTRDLRKLAKPVPIRGQQGLWRVEIPE